MSGNARDRRRARRAALAQMFPLTMARLDTWARGLREAEAARAFASEYLADLLDPRPRVVVDGRGRPLVARPRHET